MNALKKTHRQARPAAAEPAVAGVPSGRVEEVRRRPGREPRGAHRLLRFCPAAFLLLLVLVTVLDIVLAHDPTRKAKVLNSTFSHFPGIGDTLRNATAGHRRVGPASPWSSGSS